jgi:predicted Fe-Mo cluster-binding NifX family protein
MSNTRSVAIACEGPEGLGSNISGHFGHTPFFVVAELDGSKILSTKVVASPGHGEGGCSMPQFIQQLGAQALVVGGMGARAADMLTAFGVEVMGGASGNAGEALAALAAGSLEKRDSTCAGYGSAGHTCGHQHHD